MIGKRTWVAIVCVAWGTACTAPSESDRESTLVLWNATVVDGTGAPPRTNQTIVMSGTQIIETGDTSRVTIPPGARIVDVSNRWVVPGFVDLHVHLPPDSTLHGPVLSRLLQFGVTSILNPGARPGAGPDLRSRLLAGEITGPQMKTAGSLIDVTPEGRGYGAWATQAPTVAAIRAEVRRQQGLGVDFVKLYAGLGPELVTAALEEAQLAGVPVIGHLESTNWTDAAELGIRMLVHSGWSTPMDELVDLPTLETGTDAEWYAAYADAPNGPRFAALAQALLDHDVVVVPTLGITQAGALGRDAELLPLFRTELAPERDLPGWWGDGWEERHPQYGDTSEEEGRLLEEVYFPGVLAIHRAFFERGVTFGVGTDVGNAWMTPGVSFHHEMDLYQEAGIPPLEILTMATRNGADALGLGASTGTIEVGKRADLVVLDADPTADIRNARRITRVFLAGVEIERR